MKKLVIFLLAVLLVSCATPQQREQATQGVTFETGKSREAVMDATIQLLTEEGFSIDTINEKYGIVNTKPQIILTGELMKKLGEPGSGFVATNTHLNHTIEFSATISKEGSVHLKSLAYEVKNENIMSTIMADPNARRSRAVDVFRTVKLQEYYIKMIKTKLGIMQE